MSPANCEAPRRLALVDGNNFYVSCERVFQPAWERRPVGVLSNNDGCLIARSNELKAAGIPMGAPYFQVREPLRALNAVVVSSNYALYGDLSARLMETLASFTPTLDSYSIDEAWLDLTGIEPAGLDTYGRRIALTVRQHTGLPVSLGIASTHVLAKIANRLCKQRQIPGQVFNLGNADSLDAVLATVAVGEVWGIGRHWAEQLQRQGITTALALRNADPRWIRERYNVVLQRIVLELRGIPCLGGADIPPKQQIIVSRTFGERVTEIASLHEAITRYATRAGEKLRAQQAVCGALQVSIRTGRHNSQESYYGGSALVRLAVPTADTRPLIQAARRGIERVFKPGPRYAQAGVMLLDLRPAAAGQGDLFEPADRAPAQRLMHVVDQINRRYGAHTVCFAGEGLRQPWAMQRRRMTPAFTTRREELPVVR